MTKSSYKQKINFHYNPDIDNKDLNEKLTIKENITGFLKSLGEVSASQFTESELFPSDGKISKVLDNKELINEVKRVSALNKAILAKLTKIEEEMIDEQDTSIGKYGMGLSDWMKKMEENCCCDEEENGSLDFPDFDKRRKKDKNKKRSSRRNLKSKLVKASMLNNISDQSENRRPASLPQSSEKVQTEEEKENEKRRLGLSQSSETQQNADKELSPEEKRSRMLKTFLEKMGMPIDSSDKTMNTDSKTLQEHQNMHEETKTKSRVGKWALFGSGLAGLSATSAVAADKKTDSGSQFDSFLTAINLFGGVDTLLEASSHALDMYDNYKQHKEINTKQNTQVQEQKINETTEEKPTKVSSLTDRISSAVSELIQNSKDKMTALGNFGKKSVIPIAIASGIGSEIMSDKDLEKRLYGMDALNRSKEGGISATIGNFLQEKTLLSSNTWYGKANDTINNAAFKLLLSGYNKMTGFEDQMSIIEERIDKLAKQGIVSKNLLSKDRISNWDKVKDLNLDDLLSLSLSNDINEEDKIRVKNLLLKKQKNQIIIPEVISKDYGSEVVFNEEDIMAYELTSAKNDYDRFLIQHPLNDENVIVTEKIVNGERIKDIKFKKDELNKEYLELKSKYDLSFKKYLDYRNAKLKADETTKEIDGQTLSEKEYNTYMENKSSYSSVKDFVNTTVNTNANKTVEDLIAKYKDIPIPSESIPLIERIKGAEGFVPTAYGDGEGKKSIGFGHQIKNGEEYLLNATLTEEQAQGLLVKDLEIYTKAAKNINGYSDAPKRVQEALIDMTYNMGENWISSWPTFAKNLAEKKYAANADIIRHSKYASQVQGRAFINANIFDEAEKQKSGVKQDWILNKAKDIFNTSKISETNVNTAETQNKDENINIKRLDNEDAIQEKEKKDDTVDFEEKNLLQQTKTYNISYNNVQSNNLSITQPNNSIIAGNDKKDSSLFELFTT